eukprot:TRINITY_DN10000_c0_g1_i1.p1 TRINITY_DN10000_c0_g1~~TRINITY_DN10000_c0_g1_i1.p1  ORF type:complete len:157 (-),score=19.83 TRINITY_DN10000_c0_g1_i1:34-447(-)
MCIRDLSNFSSPNFPFPCATEHPDKMVYGLQRGRMTKNRDPRVPVIRNLTTIAPAANSTDAPVRTASPLNVMGGRWRAQGLEMKEEEKLVGHGADLLKADTAFDRGGGIGAHSSFLPTSERLYTLSLIHISEPTRPY